MIATHLFQVNFLSEESPLSLSSLSALDGVKKEVNVFTLATAHALKNTKHNQAVYGRGFSEGSRGSLTSAADLSPVGQLK